MYTVDACSPCTAGPKWRYDRRAGLCANVPTGRSLQIRGELPQIFDHRRNHDPGFRCRFLTTAMGTCVQTCFMYRLGGHAREPFQSRILHLVISQAPDNFEDPFEPGNLPDRNNAKHLWPVVALTCIHWYETDGGWVMAYRRDPTPGGLRCKRPTIIFHF